MTTSNPDAVTRLLTGSTPSQTALDALLARTTRVRVWSGGDVDEIASGARVLADIIDRTAVDRLRAVLELDGRDSLPAADHGPVLELLGSGDERVALLVLDGGRTLRWRGLTTGLQRYGDALNDWLRDHGVPGPHAEFTAYVLAYKRNLAAKDDDESLHEIEPKPKLRRPWWRFW